MALSLATAPMGMATAGPIKLGVNGFGRIGRQVVRIAMDRESFILKHINSPMAPEYMKYLLEHDTVHGRFSGTCEVAGDALIINGAKVTLSATRVPAGIPWTQTGVEYVCESTGAFTTTEGCMAHIEGGAKKVIISAPAKDAETPTLVVGVNQDDYDSKSMAVVSCASCTTNGLAPLVKTINEKFGIKQGLMTTVHAATASQLTVDGNARAATLMVLATRLRPRTIVLLHDWVGRQLAYDWAVRGGGYARVQVVQSMLILESTRGGDDGAPPRRPWRRSPAT